MSLDRVDMGLGKACMAQTEWVCIHIFEGLVEGTVGGCGRLCRDPTTMLFICWSLAVVTQRLLSR